MARAQVDRLALQVGELASIDGGADLAGDGNRHAAPHDPRMIPRPPPPNSHRAPGRSIARPRLGEHGCSCPVPRLTDALMYTFDVFSYTLTSMLDSLLPRNRIKVLGLLLGNPSNHYYLREIARACGIPLRAVQRELALYEAMGLVRRVPRGSRSSSRSRRPTRCSPSCAR